MYTYYFATVKQKQPGFPHATITNTACPYPQDVIFRWTMLIGGSFISLIYYVIFRWIESEKKRI
jgi:hypothetical protein